MKKLIIAEKPKVMRDFVKALEPNAKSVQYAKPYVYYYEGTNYIFAAANGHLFQLKSPEEIDESNKKWQASPLALPEHLPLKPIKSTVQSFNCLKQLVKRNDIDEIIVATDPDREGQLIWALIAENLKIKVPVTRAWIHEWTAEGLKKAFKSRKNNKDYRYLEDAGRGRIQADYIIGMTGTRVNTVCFGGYKNVINEGRVQSPTRQIVGDLEKKILNFQKEDYATIALSTTSEESSPLLLNSARLTMEEADEVLANMPQSYTIQKDSQVTSKRCPMLYKTNDIIIDAGRQLKLSSDKITEILQKLYQDYALTTYPRTEIRQISASSAKDVMKIVNSLDGVGLVDDIINDIKANHYTFASHLVNNTNQEMPHEAITPTYDGNPGSTLSKLSSDERAVYTLIVKRFLQGFFPNAQVEETKVSTAFDYQSPTPSHMNNVKHYVFTNNGKSIIDAGWMKVSGIPSDTILPQVQNGHIYDFVKAEKQLKQTKPPKRFSEPELFQAMDNAGRYVEDEDDKKVLKDVKGIGTEATRSGIVQNLYKSGFLKKIKGTIYPTEKLMSWMDNTPETPLKSPAMTARLESQLSEVEEGKLPLSQFMKTVNAQVDEMVDIALKAPKKTVSSNNTKATATSSPRSTSNGNSEVLGVCPCCGRDIRENSKSYYCTGYRDGCSFSIWKTIAGKKISKTTAKGLLNKGESGVLKGFKSKAGKDFSARLVVNKATQKIELSFK